MPCKACVVSEWALKLRGTTQTSYTRFDPTGLNKNVFTWKLKIYIIFEVDKGMNYYYLKDSSYKNVNLMAK